jgi:hypothetical protein
MIQKLLPRKIRHALLRRFLVLDPTPSPRLQIRIAKTREELEAAFRLLHNAYVSSGFMDPEPSGLRVTKFHSLPATTTIVALWDGEVVGTGTLIRRSSFGMPMESIFDISHLIEDGSRIFETSSLAVHPRFSGQHGKILLPLMKYISEYSVHYFGSKYMAIAVNPAWIDFYEAILGFKRLKAKPVPKYSFVKGAPAVGAYLDVQKYIEITNNLYGDKKIEKNICKYFFKHPLPNLHFPERILPKISDPVLTPETIDYFFNKRTRTFSTMSEREIYILHQLYEDDSFRSVLPPPPENPSKVVILRSSVRFEVHFPGQVLLPENLRIPMTVTEISRTEVAIIPERPLRADEVFTLSILVNGTSYLLQRAKLQWSSPNQRKCVLEVREMPQEWLNLVTLLKNDVLRKAA